MDAQARAGDCAGYVQRRRSGTSACMCTYSRLIPHKVIVLIYAKLVTRALLVRCLSDIMRGRGKTKSGLGKRRRMSGRFRVHPRLDTRDAVVFFYQSTTNMYAHQHMATLYCWDTITATHIIWGSIFLGQFVQCSHGHAQDHPVSGHREGKGPCCCWAVPRSALQILLGSYGRQQCSMHAECRGIFLHIRFVSTSPSYMRSDEPNDAVFSMELTSMYFPWSGR